MPKKIIKDKLTRFREVFFREKYRFDQGNAFLVFVNFALLVITLVHLTSGNQSYILFYIIGGLFLTWLLGYFLDRFVRVQDIQERVVLQRSPIWHDVFRKHDYQERKLEELARRLGNFERRLERFERKMEKLEANFESLIERNHIEINNE